MITFYSRKYEVKAQASFTGVDGLVAFDDLHSDDVETGLATFTFSVNKTTDDVEKVALGDYIRVLTATGRKLWFEVLDMTEDHDRIDFVAVDGGLDLIGETVWPYDADKSYDFKHYFDKFTYDSGWELGRNEIAGKTRKLKYEGFETATKRLRQVARSFDAELEYEIIEESGKPTRKLIHVVQRLGRNTPIRLEYGREITNITRKSSIQNLATALRGHGANDITLNGYKYNDGRYWVGGDTIHDLQEGARWSRHADVSRDGGYVVDTYESQAQTQERLFQETLAQLKKRAYPEVEYTVEFSELPEEVRKGDTVEIVDYTFKPALKISARVQKIEGRVAVLGDGKAVISNIEYKETNVDDRLKAVEKLLNNNAFDFSKVPAVLNIYSQNGTVFTDKASTTLEAKVTRFDIDVAEQYTFKWKRKSDKQPSTDDEWNALDHTGKTLQLSKADINVQATFICEAYKNGERELVQSIYLKDIVIAKYRGNTPPENAQSGDLWTDTSGTKEVVKIYVNGQWSNVISDNQQDIEKFKRDWETNNREYADKLTAIIQEIESVKENEKYTRDLTGRFGDLEEAYKRILEQEQTIKGLGERQKALELNLEQSSAIIRTLGAMFDFSDDGFLIGRKDANMQMKLNNDRLEFLDGGKVTAYMTGQKMFIVSGAFWQSITIGNHIFEKFGDEFTFISYAGVLNK